MRRDTSRAGGRERGREKDSRWEGEGERGHVGRGEGGRDGRRRVKEMEGGKEGRRERERLRD